LAQNQNFSLLIRCRSSKSRRCAKMGLRGGDLAFKRMTPPLYTHEWVPPVGGGG
jgi:hypothetical protein